MTSPQDFSAQFSVQDRNRAAGALIRTAGGFSLAAPCPSPPAPQPDIRVPPFVGSGVGQKACGCSGMIVVRQGAAWALAGSGMLIGPDAFLTVRHVAAGLSALQDPGGLSGHVPGAAVRLVLGPAAPGAHWVTPFTLPPGAGVSLTGASVRADAKGTVAVIRLPIPLPGAQGWALSDVGELGLFTDVIAIGTPNPLTLGAASPFIQKVFAVSDAAGPRVDVLNLRGTAGRITGPANASGLFPHTANTENGMSGAGLFRAQDGALIGLNTRGLPSVNEAVAITNALPLFG